MAADRDIIVSVTTAKIRPKSLERLESQINGVVSSNGGQLSYSGIEDGAYGFHYTFEDGGRAIHAVKVLRMVPGVVKVEIFELNSDSNRDKV